MTWYFEDEEIRLLGMIDESKGDVKVVGDGVGESLPQFPISI